MHKPLLTCLLALLAFASFAQIVPAGFNYQAIARQSTGDPIASTQINIQLTIQKTLPGGNIVWQERHLPTTNQFGLFNLIIGSGTRQATSTVASFSDIYWGGDVYYLKVEQGVGSTWTDLGTTQFMSVPYAMASKNGVPPGTIIAFAGASVPDGWLLCDGATSDRTTYATLFDAIGIAWGSGDGTTTFHLPDLRGRFLRGVDGVAGRDPDKSSRSVANTGGNTGNNVGSVQNDMFLSHTHNIGSRRAHTTTESGLVGRGASLPTQNINVDYTGGNETRPKNANVNYIIKY